MRAPYQILAIPYKMVNGLLLYCVFHRSDLDQWQFIAGGGEDDETPIQAAKREIFEESGVDVPNIMVLKSTCYLPPYFASQDKVPYRALHSYQLCGGSFLRYDCKI